MSKHHLVVVGVVQLAEQLCSMDTLIVTWLIQDGIQIGASSGA
jgi:hypothetical protein